MAHLSKLTSPDAVRRAMAEYDRLGEEAFLQKYNFGESQSYYINSLACHSNKLARGIFAYYSMESFVPRRTKRRSAETN